MPSARYVFLLILAVLCPPAPVFYRRGCSQDLLLNIMLTLFFLLPGIVHAILIVYLYDDARTEKDALRGAENGWANGKREKHRSSYVPPTNTVVPYPPGRFQGFASSGNASPGNGGGNRMSKPYTSIDSVHALLEPQAVVHRGWYI